MVTRLTEYRMEEYERRLQALERRKHQGGRPRQRRRHRRARSPAPGDLSKNRYSPKYDAQHSSPSRHEVSDPCSELNNPFIHPDTSTDLDFSSTRHPQTSSPVPCSLQTPPPVPPFRVADDEGEMDRSELDMIDSSKVANSSSFLDQTVQPSTSR